jgi:hypothetical protein
MAITIEQLLSPPFTEVEHVTVRRVLDLDGIVALSVEDDPTLSEDFALDDEDLRDHLKARLLRVDTYASALRILRTEFATARTLRQQALTNQDPTRIASWDTKGRALTQLTTAPSRD